MDNQLPKLDRSKLTSEQLDKLDAYEATQKGLQTLEDVASISHELLNVVSDGQDKQQNFGTLLLDIRETLGAIKDRETPEAPDYAKPVVEALKQAERELTSALKAIDIKPVVNVDAPQVNVSPPHVDLKGVEKAMQSLPGAFEKAIKLIPPVPQTDFQPLLDAWQGISEQLDSLETATRMKPMPGSMKVTNPDGSVVYQKNILRGYHNLALTNADANGNYQTITYTNDDSSTNVLTLTFDGSNNVTNISRV